MSNPEPLQYGAVYHIYNRGNNGENIFREKRNYPYFLDLYAKHVAPFVDTYAYSLLRNHFHFAIRVKEKEEILRIDRNLTGLEASQKHDLSGLSKKLPSQKFANLFNAYAKSINKSYGRSGALFERPFGRKLVTSEAHLFHLIQYVHFNPQKHGFVADFREWQHSSYPTLTSSSSTKLAREEVLKLFDGLKSFEKEHAYEVIDTDFLQNFIGEDLD